MTVQEAIILGTRLDAIDEGMEKGMEKGFEKFIEIMNLVNKEISDEEIARELKIDILKVKKIKKILKG